MERHDLADLDLLFADKRRPGQALSLRASRPRPARGISAVASMRRGHFLAAEKPASVARATGPDAQTWQGASAWYGGRSTPPHPGDPHPLHSPDGPVHNADDGSRGAWRSARAGRSGCHTNPGTWDDFKGRQSHHPPRSALSPALLLPRIPSCTSTD